MIVFITGASGFIGSRLAGALLARGHAVRAAQRRPPAATHAGLAHVPADFARDHRVEDWIERVRGADVVVNTVGILREQPGQSFEALHLRAPIALFRACAAAGVRRVVQVSALGADERARSPYHLSKRGADEALLALPLSSVVAQPSLVFGPGGASAAFFARLASLPVLALPADGRQAIQPVHIDDLVEALVALVEGTAFLRQRVPLTGPEPTTLRDFLLALRRALGLGRPLLSVHVPAATMRLAARVGDHLRGALLDSDSWGMLQRGNTGDAGAITALIGHAPRRVEDFLAPREADTLRREAQRAWLLPLLRTSIAIMWIVTGLVSLGLYPVEESYALLARVGAPAWAQPPLLFGAALLDLTLGILTLALRRRHRLWLAQMGLIVFYTALITWRLPEYWLHPYGPVLKNLPILAALWLLDGEEARA